MSPDTVTDLSDCEEHSAEGDAAEFKFQLMIQSIQNNNYHTLSVFFSV